MENDNIYAAPEADLEPEFTDTPEFFVVGTRKLAIMGISTLGLYYVYFFYKQWTCLKSSQNLRAMPAMRAVFSFFFARSLSRHVLTAAESKNLTHSSNPTLWADVYLGVFIGIFVLNVALGAMGSVVPASLSLLGTLGSLASQAVFANSIQIIANLVVGDPDGEANNSISIANVFFILLGILLWISNISGLLLAS